MGKKICIICKYQPETDTFFGIILEDNFWLLWENVPPDTFIGMRMFHIVHHSEFSYVKGNP